MKISTGIKVWEAFAVSHIGGAVPFNKRMTVNDIGEAGIGKTESKRAIATKNGWAYINNRVGQMEPGDLLGLPTKKVINGQERTVFARPEYFPQYLTDKDGKIQTREDGSKILDIESLGDIVQNRLELLEMFEGDLTQVRGIVLHFDEANRAAGDDTKQAIFQLFEQYRIHSHLLPEGVFLCTSANPSTEDYQVNDSDQERAFMDRFIHMIWEATPEGYIMHAEEVEEDEAVISYINANPDALNVKSNYTINDLDIIPSARSWSRISTIRKYVKLPQDDATQRELFAGIVGMVEANNFMNHVKEHMDRAVTGEEIVKDYKKVQTKIKRAVKSNRTDYVDQVTRSFYTLLANEKNIEKYDLESEAVLKNIEMFLKDIMAEQRMTLVEQLVQFDHANEVLGASMEIYKLLSEDSKRAHSDNKDQDDNDDDFDFED